MIEISPSKEETYTVTDVPMPIDFGKRKIFDLIIINKGEDVVYVSFDEMFTWIDIDEGEKIEEIINGVVRIWLKSKSTEGEKVKVIWRHVL